MFFDLKNRADIGIVQGRERACLAHKSRLRFFCLHHFFGQKLQGNMTAEAYVLGLEYDVPCPRGGTCVIHHFRVRKESRQTSVNSPIEVQAQRYILPGTSTTVLRSPLAISDLF